MKARTVLAALGGTVLFFHRAAFSTDIFVARDILRVYYPLWAFWSERVRHWELPAWFPYDGLGQPFVGMAISGTFHPVHLLSLILPLGAALKAATILSYVAALLGAHRLAERWGASPSGAAIAATSFAFSGYLVCLSNNLLYLIAAATLPWAWAEATRLFHQPALWRAGLTGLLLASILWIGDPQTFALACAGVGVLALALPSQTLPPGRLAAAGLALAFAALFGSIQWIPSLAIRAEAVAGENALDTALIWSGHPSRLLESVWGPFWTDATRVQLLSDEVGTFLDPRAESAWVDSHAFGLIPVVLSATAAWVHRRARVAWLWAFLFGLFVWLWLGRSGGLYGVFSRLLPLWSSFRYPEKLTPFPLLLAALAAGMGWTAVEHSPSLRKRVGSLGATVAAGLAVLALCLPRISLPVSFSPESMAQLHSNLVRGNWEAAGAAAALSLACLVPLRSALRGAFVVAAVGTGLFLANGELYGLGSREILENPPPLLAKRPALRVSSSVGSVSRSVLASVENPAEEAAFATVGSLRPNTSALWGVSTFSTYLPAASRRVAALQADTLPLEAEFAVSHWVATPTQAAQVSGDLGEVAATDPRLGLGLYRIQNARTPFGIALPVCVPDAATARQWLRTHLMDARHVAVEWHGCRPNPEAETGRIGIGEDLDLRYERMTLDVDFDVPALAVVRDAFYSGWSATVDGKPAPLLAVNGAVRGVPAPAGTHRIEMVYRTPGLVWGIALYLAGWLGLLIGIGHAAFFTRRLPTASPGR